MKLKNRRTGVTGVLLYDLEKEYHFTVDTGDAFTTGIYKKLADLYEEWEDVPEEPKKHYEILGIGVVIEQEDAEDEIFRNQNQREIGNYFETREEAEKAVEKLKAFKRLKESGFEFTEWGVGFDNNLVIKAKYTRGQIYDDMNLLFGGEE